MRTLLLVAVLSLVLATLPVHANDANTTASVIIMPPQGHAGTLVYVIGYGFPAGVSATIYFDGQPVASTEADDDGIVEEWIQVPLDASPGNHVIKVVAGQASASTTFTVTRVTVTLYPSKAGVGDRVTVVVTGLAPYDAYVVCLDSIPVTPVFVADSSGTLTLAFTVPPATPSLHNVSVVYSQWLVKWIGYDFVIPLTVATTTFNITSGVTTTEDLARLQARIQALEHLVAELNESVTDNITDIQECIKNLTTTTAWLTYTVNQLHLMITGINIKLINVTHVISALNETINNVLTIIDKLSTELNETNTTTIKELQELRAQLQQLQTTLQELEHKHDTDTSNLDERVSVLEEKVTNLEKLLNKTANETVTKTKERGVQLTPEQLLAYTAISAMVATLITLILFKLTKR